MTCEFARDGLCEVSTLLISLPVALDEKACRACMNNQNPMAINSVTCSRSAWAMRKANVTIPSDVLNCIKQANSEGPGTELKKILARFATLTEDCGCNGKANIMNIWGPEECTRRMPEIVGWLREEANKRWPATKVIPIDWAIEKLVRKAIKRASRKMLRDKSQN